MAVLVRVSKRLLFALFGREIFFRGLGGVVMERKSLVTGHAEEPKCGEEGTEQSYVHHPNG
jgi:hypothetical protein